MGYGWVPSLKLDVNEKSIAKLKPKQKWDRLDNDGSEANAQALFSIFNGISPYEFRRITKFSHVKEVWDIL